MALFPSSPHPPPTPFSSTDSIQCIPFNPLEGGGGGRFECFFNGAGLVFSVPPIGFDLFVSGNRSSIFRLPFCFVFCALKGRWTYVFFCPLEFYHFEGSQHILLSPNANGLLTRNFDWDSHIDIGRCGTLFALFLLEREKEARVGGVWPQINSISRYDRPDRQRREEGGGMNLQKIVQSNEMMNFFLDHISTPFFKFLAISGVNIP